MFESVEATAEALAERRLRRRDGSRYEPLSGPQDGQSHLRGGGAGVGQDGARQGPLPGPRHSTDPPSMLRGPRRQPGGLRVELPPSAPGDPGPTRRGRLRRSPQGDIFSEEFLLRRPLLQAIDSAHERSPVLLIDELDRADEEFESFLLELLSDFQVTIPELGTLSKPATGPITVVTSNRTREIHDALKRRCVYHWIDYPSPEKELEIVRRKVPGIAEGRLGRAGGRLRSGPEPTRISTSFRASPRPSTGRQALGHLQAPKLWSGEVIDSHPGLPSQVPGRRRQACEGDAATGSCCEESRRPVTMEASGPGSSPLVANLMVFPRLLRRAGLPVSPDSRPCELSSGSSMDRHRGSGPGLPCRPGPAGDPGRASEAFLRPLSTGFGPCTVP